MASYDIGDLVRVSGAFTVSDVDTDPTTVTVLYRDPSGNLTTLVYGEDASVVKDATGQYHLDISPDETGKWWFRWVGTGDAQAAEEDYFYIKPTRTVAG